VSNHTRFVLVTTLLSAISVSSACRGSDAVKSGAVDPVPELVVRAEPAMRMEWKTHVPISGNLRSQSMVDVKSEVGGTLIAAYFREGDLVRKGQLLAEIDPANYRLALEQANAVANVAEAGLERTHVMAEHARREKERADNLLKTGGITEKDHQAASTGIKEAETQVRFAEAQIKQARAAVSIHEKAIRDCTIVAPADGHVQKKFFDQGSLLAPGSPIYTLVDNSRLELECLLPSYRLAEIRIGQRAEFTTPTYGERRFVGAVLAINPMIEADNRSIKLILRVDNPGAELRTGMYARGDIEVGRQPEAMVVPRTALLSEKEEAASGSVYVVHDGKASRRAVQVGGIQLDRVWIRSGLRDADLIIVEIGPAIKEGTPVRLAAGNGSRGE
jgi:RND family efflux transporter MFP subunit